MPKTKNKTQNPETAKFLYFQKTEIRINPKTNPAHNIIYKVEVSKSERLKKEFKKIPPTKERQKYKSIFEGVISK